MNKTEPRRGILPPRHARTLLVAIGLAGGAGAAAAWWNGAGGIHTTLHPMLTGAAEGLGGGLAASTVGVVLGITDRLRKWRTRRPGKNILNAHLTAYTALLLLLTIGSNPNQNGAKWGSLMVTIIMLVTIFSGFMDNEHKERSNGTGRTGPTN